MFKTIKAQITAYKWIIILSLIGALAVGLVWQYHRADKLQTQTDALVKDNKELEGRLTVMHTEFVVYKKRQDEAAVALEELRKKNAQIDADTKGLQGQVDRLKARKPLPDGADAKEIEAEANAFTQRVFNRIENASKGKTTDEN